MPLKPELVFEMNEQDEKAASPHFGTETQNNSKNILPKINLCLF